MRELVHARRHRAGEAVDRRPLAEDRVELGGGDGVHGERPEPLAQHVRSHERLLDRHLLVEREADQQRERVVDQQPVGLVVAGEVQPVGHGCSSGGSAFNPSGYMDAIVSSDISSVFAASCGAPKTSHRTSASVSLNTWRTLSGET